MSSGSWLPSLFPLLFPHMKMAIGERSAIEHHASCPECKRKLVNIYRMGELWKCRRCWKKWAEGKEKPRLIKTWKELKECTSETHVLDIEDCCGWIHPKVPHKKKDDWKGDYYLSTHTFYGLTHQYSTELLQSCGFNVEIANWDELGW
jgi:ribosomal protein L37AE/L43A